MNNVTQMRIAGAIVLAIVLFSLFISVEFAMCYITMLTQWSDPNELNTICMLPEFCMFYLSIAYLFYFRTKIWFREAYAREYDKEYEREYVPYRWSPIICFIFMYVSYGYCEAIKPMLSRQDDLHIFILTMVPLLLLIIANYTPMMIRDFTGVRRRPE